MSEKKPLDTRAKRLGLNSNRIEGFTFPDVDSSGYAVMLGAGGSGIVFRAYQTIADSVNVPRAIKYFLYRDDIAELTRHQKKGPISTEDFKAEILNITSFNHQHLVKVIDAGVHKCEEGDVPYIVTDFVSGPTLKELIETQNSKDCLDVRERIREKPELIIDLMIKVGSAIAHIFDRGFSHCDIAPKNIFLQLISGEIEPILGDLGISKKLNPKEASRETVFIAGSKTWMPPEVIKYLEKEVSYDQFSSFQPYWDIYSYCATGLSLLDSFVEASESYWFEAVKKAFSNGLEAGGYKNIRQVLYRLEFLNPIYREVARIPELSNGIGLGVRKMMPVEALKVTNRLNEIIKHPAIFRLSKVPQLTTANYVLPGATHTRYEHTLGVIETMRRYLISLLDEKEFLAYFSVEKVEVALVASALSSISRFPLSNIVHEMRGRDKSHYESLSSRSALGFLTGIKNRSGSTIIDVVEENFSNLCLDNLNVILKRDGDSFDEADSLIHSMLHSSLDVRVLDFVRRDAHHLGIISGETFHLDEILAHLTVHDHKLSLRATGVSVAEHVVSLRYWLFSRAYWNRPNRAYFAMCRYVLSQLQSKGMDSQLFPALLEQDQAGVLDALSSASERAGLDDCIAILSKIRGDESHIYQVVFEGNRESVGERIIDWFSVSSFEVVDRFIMSLEAEFLSFCEGYASSGERLLLWDFPTEPGSNKLGADVMVTDRRSSPAALTKKSKIVRGVNDSFHCQLSKLRIFRHPLLRVKDGCRERVEEFFLENLERVV